MSSPQQLAIVAGLTQQRRFAGQEITYHRGSTEVEFTAIKGRHRQQMADASGWVQTPDEITDWIFELDELEDLTPAYPQAGDWIEWGGKKLAAVAVEDGRIWRAIDPEETWIRCHTIYAGDSSNTTTTAAPTTTTTAGA